MKRVLFFTFLFFVSTMGFAQSEIVDWKTVKVYEFESRSFPDTLEICGGEWFIKGNANNLKELNSSELERIQKKVAKYGCNIAYVDTKKVFTPSKGELYILGLKRKEQNN